MVERYVSYSSCFRLRNSHTPNIPQAYVVMRVDRIVTQGTPQADLGREPIKATERRRGEELQGHRQLATLWSSECLQPVLGWMTSGCPSSRSMMVRALVRRVVGVHRAAGWRSLPAASGGAFGLWSRIPSMQLDEKLRAKTGAQLAGVARGTVLCWFTAPLLLEPNGTRVLKQPTLCEIGRLDLGDGRLQAAYAGATRCSRSMRLGRVAKRQEHPSQNRIRGHRFHEATVSHDDARGPYGNHCSVLPTPPQRPRAVRGGRRRSHGGPPARRACWTGECGRWRHAMCIPAAYSQD